MILLLDNHDSFVHNLARYLRNLGQETNVVRSDEIDANGCFAMRPDGIVISPGPRRPEDAGCSVDVIRQSDPGLPILGVCLGHQAIGYALGAKIIQCDPVHGMASQIQNNQLGVFANSPKSMMVGRYHSLAIDPETLPQELVVTATCPADGVIMGVQHKTRPVFGVQFHPESVLSDHGAQVLAAFSDIAVSSQQEIAS